MAWETVREAGYLFEKNNLKGKGMIKSRKFLYSVTKAFAKSCVDYFNVTGELPFIYHERQIHSALLPSIAKVSEAAFMEQPVTRKGKGSSSHGWVDYWVMYGNYTFLIEVKHAWCSVTSGEIRKSTQKAYSQALEQLKRISSSEASRLSGTGIRLAKIALAVFPFYQASKNKDKLAPITDKEKIEEIHDFLVTDLTPSPNWSCMWLLHERLQEIESYDNDRYEIYPCVGIIAQVDNC